MEITRNRRFLHWLIPAMMLSTLSDAQGVNLRPYAGAGWLKHYPTEVDGETTKPVPSTGYYAQVGIAGNMNLIAASFDVSYVNYDTKLSIYHTGGSYTDYSKGTSFIRIRPLIGLMSKGKYKVGAATGVAYYIKASSNGAAYFSLPFQASIGYKIFSVVAGFDYGLTEVDKTTYTNNGIDPIDSKKRNNNLYLGLTVSLP